MNNIIASEHTGYNIIYRLLLPSGKIKYVRKESGATLKMIMVKQLLFIGDLFKI